MIKNAYERREYAMPDGTLSALHFGDTTQPVKLMFLHANGFNALSYRALLEPLGVHTVALDLRGHGFSTLPADPDKLSSWLVFSADITTFFERYIDQPVVIAGHSFGAVSGVLAAQALGDKCAGFVGFDPVFLPFPARLFAKTKWGRQIMKTRIPIATKAGRRRAEFASVDAAFENYKGRGAFKTVRDDILLDYVQGGLVGGGLVEGNSTMRLACEPLWEQAIFCAQDHSPLKAIKYLPPHRKIIFAGKNSPTPFSIQAGLKSRLKQKGMGESVISNSKLAHLFPLQNPEMASQALADMLKRADL